MNRFRDRRSTSSLHRHSVAHRSDRTDPPAAGGRGLATLNADMATWGPSKKPEQRALPAARTSTPSKSSNGGGTKGSGSSNVTRARYTADEQARRQATRREQATGELRRAIAGREHEFIGLILIVAAVILAAGIYFDFAGILGDGIEWLGGALAGLGRYVLPSRAVDRRRVVHPQRTLVQPVSPRDRLGACGLTALGILHVAQRSGGILGRRRHRRRWACSDGWSASHCAR